MGQATAAERPLRADARRNHERILVVARAAVYDRGAEIVLEDIAREAGVGIGTLYRHFPNRQALLEAIFLDETEELRIRAEELAGHDRPFDALVAWLHLQMDFATHGRCLGASVMSAKLTEGSPIQVAYVGMRAAGTLLLDDAKSAGTVRPEVDLGDVLRLIHGVVLVNEQAADPAGAGRMFDLVIAGIRT